MQLPDGLLQNGIEALILVFIRMTGLFVISPIFGRRNIPVYLKVGLSFTSALILVNTIKLPAVDYNENLYFFTFLIFKEFVVGVVLGYISYIIFNAIMMAGQLIDMQVGFGMVNVLDPVSNIQIPISSNFYYITSMLVLLAINGHHIIIKGLFDSYRFVPLGGAVFTEALMGDVLRNFVNMFFVSFKICAPIIAAILITDIALGIISKSIPQLNVFIVGMPAKIILGVLVMALTIPVFISLVGVMINGMEGEMFKVLKDMISNK